MRKRAEHMGATFHVERRDGGDTFVFMQLPLDSATKGKAGEMIASDLRPA